MQAFSPETIAHDRRRLTLIGFRIQAPDRTADAKDIEEIRAGRDLPDSFVASIRAPTGISKPGIECQVLKDSCMSQVAVPAGGYGSAESYQPVRLPCAQVIQNHLFGDTVDGDVGPNTQRQRSNRNESQRGRVAETPQALPKVGQHHLNFLARQEHHFGTRDQATVSPKWYFSSVNEAQKLSGVVLGSLDQEQDAKGLARQAYRSRTQFYRVFQAMIDETPVAMRRRLLLERAAWQLSRTNLSVTDISLNANYQSLEAFSRAFRKAFRVSPSLYRRMGATYTHLHAINGIHHHSGNDDTKGANQSMDLFDIFSGQESWHTRRLLELAKTLNNEQLDRPLQHPVKVFPWEGPDQSLRQILDRMVQTKEAWAAALTGGTWSPNDGAAPANQTPSAMLARLDSADAGFHNVLIDVRNRSAWCDTFVDALCEPPETFTFGGMFAHVITFNAHRRMLAMDALRHLGVKVEGFGCPSEYMSSVVSG